MAEPTAPSEDPALDRDDDRSWEADELPLDRVQAAPVPTPVLDSGAPEPIRAEPAQPAPTSGPTIALSILGGVFLAYAVSWAVIARVTGDRALPTLIPGLTWVLLVAAVLAPVLWEAMLLWGVHRPVLRWTFAAVGVLVLFPFPLILTMLGGAR
ncbi:MAG: hypothetical protein LKF88_04010 [Microbacteriaceae bacterium]|jgi:hypothetical protein|nr:hypothetical protein [Microbacteriaceae bacterium]MCI1207359.1 hypothetical protein [Microbacteriaceae bacterium]